MPDTEPVVPETVTTEAPAAEPVVDWDGSFESLDAEKYDWWKGVPDRAREHIAKWHADLTETKAKHDYLDTLFRSDDAVAEITKERDGLKESLSKIQTEYQGVRERNAQLESQFEQIESDRQFEALEKKFPDVFADFVPGDEKAGKPASGAFMTFVKLRNAGFSDDDAARLARVDIKAPAATATTAPTTPAATTAAPAKTEPPAPKPEREVKPPPGVAAMGKGGNASATTRTPIEELDAAFKRIQQEEESRFR